MTDEKTKILYEKYPKIFAQKDLPMSQTCMCWGIECGDGWFNIIDALCADIQFYVDEQNKRYDWRVKDAGEKEEDRPNYQVEATQVKEKFGGLRFYTANSDDYVDGMICMAESMSMRTCENCGNPGKTGGSGWITTLCEPCRELDKKRRDEYLAETEARMAQYKAERAAKEQSNG